MKSIDSAKRSPSKLSLLRHSVILFGLDAGMRLSLLQLDVIPSGYDAGVGQLPLTFGGTGTGFFLIGSCVLGGLLSREELLEWSGNCLLSLSIFHNVDSMLDTSSFASSCGSDNTSWLFISGSKCCTSSYSGALDPKILETSIRLSPNTVKYGVFGLLNSSLC